VGTTKKSAAADAALVRLRVTPRAAHDEVTGWREPGVLAVRVTAPPVEGEANRAVVAVLARALRVPPSAIEVVRGDRGRDKVVRITGIGTGEVETRVARLAETS
jgi:uncharacterized protein (TIGR00251 family)